MAKLSARQMNHNLMKSIHGDNFLRHSNGKSIFKKGYDPTKAEQAHAQGMYNFHHDADSTLKRVRGALKEDGSGRYGLLKGFSKESRTTQDISLNPLEASYDKGNLTFSNSAKDRAERRRIARIHSSSGDNVVAVLGNSGEKKSAIGLKEGYQKSKDYELQEKYHSTRSNDVNSSYDEAIKENQRRKEIAEEPQKRANFHKAINLKEIHGDNLKGIDESGNPIFKEGYDHQSVTKTNRIRQKSGYDKKSVDDAYKEAIGMQHKMNNLKDIHGDALTGFDKQQKPIFKEGYDRKEPEIQAREERKAEEYFEKRKTERDQRKEDNPSESHNPSDPFAGKDLTPREMQDHHYQRYLDQGMHKGVAKILAGKNVAATNRINAFEKAMDNMTPEEIEAQVRSIGGTLGKKGDDLTSFVEGNIKDGKANIAGLHGAANNHLYEANLYDKALGHKVPQAGVGLLGTAWLVSNMAGSKGQQTNGQLYGQQTPYY